MTDKEIEEFKDHYLNKAQQIPDDTELLIAQSKLVLEDLDYTRTGTFMDILRAERDEAQLAHDEHMQWMCCEVQKEIEKLKTLIKIDTQRGWNMAGDIMIPMWEHLFERGIKHEIAMHVKVGQEGSEFEQFDNKDSFNVFTREEMEAQIRAVAEGDS